MIDPPSKRLVQTLLDLKLCTLADLRRCRGRVRLLARDLPAFDSVWIDALLQAGKLTPFQARILESPNPLDLRVGPCLLITELGRSERAVTHLARLLQGRERNVLKLMDISPERLQPSFERLQEAVARTRGFAHPALVAPHRALLHGERLVTLSRYIPGPHLGELIVRRGRFAPDVVMQIGRQLVDGLAALEQRGGVHGEIRLNNVRLTTSGQAVLVDAVIGPAVRPILSIHSGLSLERCNGVAPELVSTGLAPNSVSDIYSLGCLLWHLLAGRPMFPMGDPLARLAAHQTRPAPDIREWAPDTPAPLAEAIRAFTRLNPQERPPSFTEIKNRWGAPRRRSNRRLARFRKSFNTSAPRVPELPSASARKWPLLVLFLFVLTGASLTLLDAGATSDALNISAARPAWTETLTQWWNPASPEVANTEPPSSAPNSPKTSDTGFLPLPAPDANGVILLEHPGPFSWTRVDAVGPLTIRGVSGVSPVVAIDAQPAAVVCERLTLENVHFRHAGMLPQLGGNHLSEQRNAEIPSPAALLLVQSQMLIVRNCSFVAGPFANPAQRTYGLGWKAIDPENPLSGIVSLENTTFVGSSSALYLSTVPQMVEARNCLKLGRGPLLSVSAHPRSGRQFRITLDRVTLREAESLLRIHEPIRTSAAGRVLVEANDCVFDLGGANAALFQWMQPETLPAQLTRRRNWTLPIALTGEGSLTRPGVGILSSRDPVTGAESQLDSLPIELEGLLSDDFQFAGPLSLKPAAAEVASFQAPRRAPFPPGIDASRLALPAVPPAPSADEPSE